MNTKRLATVVLLLGTALATLTGSASAAAAAGPSSTAAAQFAGMDEGVAAGQDFYAYANGAWMKNRRDSVGPEPLRRCR